MTAIEFQLRNGIDDAVDASSLRRSCLVGLSIDEIQQQPIQLSGRRVPLGEVFDVHVDHGVDDRLVVRGDLENVHGLAASHDQGDFIIEGSVGDYCAAGFSGGSLRVEGNAGNFVGGALAGKRTGMSGGLVRILGSVGSHAGHRMRRGMMLIEQDAGAALAASMVAGTIVLGGRHATNLGCEMKRGSILLCGRQAPEAFGGSARYSGRLPFAADFLRLYRDPPVTDLIQLLLASRSVLRVRADISSGGQGEILFPAESR
ncbi:MAG: formylmethanofuran dehydrogenase subunit C [Planctomycetota bacterium]